MFKLSPENTPLTNDISYAMRKLEMKNGMDISLDSFDWNIYPEEARETIVFPSNNDCGIARSPFLIENMENIIIDGKGGSLIVRGTPQAGRGRIGIIDSPIIPFIIRASKNITIRNLRIDYATPSTAEGICVCSNENYFEVEMKTSQRFWCWNSQLYLESEGYTFAARRLLGVNPQTKAILYGDNFGGGYDVSWTYENAGENRVRISGGCNSRPKEGDIILFWCTNFDTGARRAPAIFAEKSKNIRFENVIINYCMGMGLIAQNCENISLHKYIVEPSQNRSFSLAADGTHFVNCRGELSFDSCRIQNQFDDAINAHGLYYQVIRATDKIIRVKTAHPQHQGVDVYEKGDKVRIGSMPFLETIKEAYIVSINRINSEIIDFELDTSGVDIAEGSFIENISANPNITIKGCEFKHNRARGILINGNGKILVENNYFENPGSAILIESSETWGESGPVSDVTIKDNTFNNCAFAHSWGEYTIKAVPEFRKKAPEDLEPFHGKITIRNNIFKNCPSRLKLLSFKEVDSDI